MICAEGRNNENGRNAEAAKIRTTKKAAGLPRREKYDIRCYFGKAIFAAFPHVTKADAPRGRMPRAARLFRV